MEEIKDKDRILKAAREKQLATYTGTPIRPSADFSAETLQAKKGVAQYIQGKERKKPTTKITLPSKDLIQIPQRN